MVQELPTDPQPPKKKRRTLGKALPWTDADITELAHVTGHDKHASAALWESAAPARFKSLLQAVETKEGN